MSSDLPQGRGYINTIRLKNEFWWAVGCHVSVSSGLFTKKIQPCTARRVLIRGVLSLSEKSRRTQQAKKEPAAKKKKAASMKKAVKRKKPPQSRDWEKLDFRKSGGRGAYLLVGIGNQAMNVKVEGLLQLAGSARKNCMRH